MNDIETEVSVNTNSLGKDVTIYRVDFNKGPQGRVFADVVQFTTGYLFEEEPSESSIDYEELNLRNDFFNNMVKNIWLKHFVLTLGLGNMAIRLDDNKGSIYFAE